MPPQILLIEDNAQNLYMLTFLLEKHDYRVLQARTGREGIDIACREKPDLILLDIQLPEMDGYEVARRLRERSECGMVPIVAVTSYAMVGDRDCSLAAGCNGYIEKPIDPRTFVAEMEEYLMKR